MTTPSDLAIVAATALDDYASDLYRADFGRLATILATETVYSTHVDWLADDVRRWAREWAALDDGGVAA